jgi:hypothetical protein
MSLAGLRLPYRSGFEQGRIAREAVRANLGGFVSALGACGIDVRALRDRAVAGQGGLAESTRAQIAGIAEGAGEPFSLLLAYNLYRELAAVDGCTVMAALGSASATGRTLFMKNSDQVGNESMVGPGFHLHKDVYVVQVTRAANGRRIVGLSAAGATGIKVGVNDCGVAAGSNIARTVELAARRTDVSQVRASDRTQLLREGLEEETALAAAQRILANTLEAPTSTPGNMEFADAREAWVLETSYDRFACEVTRDGPLVRTNRFQTLEYLNDPGDTSSVDRYARCSALLEEGRAGGGVTFDDLIAASADHANGPGESSICRHGADYREETSLGAGVIEIDPDQPERSRIALALGKPCHAWRAPESRIELTADAALGDIPAAFLDGSAWRLSYSEEPYAGALVGGGREG